MNLKSKVIVKYTSMACNENSSYILMDGVCIWNNDCLLSVDDK